MDLSVIIVSYNVRYFLGECLSSVFRALKGIDAEVIVVDNNSGDGSCTMVAEKFPEVQLIANNENKGFAAANNQALKSARGRYLLLLNPDTLVEEDAFGKCIRFMDEHVEAGACGVMMINGSGSFLPESKRSLPTPLTAFFKISGINRLFPRSGIFNRYYLGNTDLEETVKVEVLPGAYMFLRNEALNKTGLLDEKFFMYGEDIDISYRLTKAGYANYYFPGTKIIHFKGESTNREHLNTVLNFYRAMLIFVEKHFNSGSYRWYVLIVKIAIFFRAGLSVLKRMVKRAFSPLFKLFAAASALRFHYDSEDITGFLIISDSDAFQKIQELIYSLYHYKSGPGKPGNEYPANLPLAASAGELREKIIAGKISILVFSTSSSKISGIINMMQAVSDLPVRIRIISRDFSYIYGNSCVKTEVISGMQDSKGDHVRNNHI